MRRPLSIRSALVVTSALTLVGPASSQSPDGPWIGSISVLGSELKIMVTFASRGDSVTATIDIPQQMAMGLALKNVSWRPPRTHFELPAGPGLAVFEGIVRGDSVTGGFTQAGFQGTFRLERGKNVHDTGAQPPSESPPPYREEEVSFASDTLTVAGTLTLPPTKGRHPAVILITGSGAHNRDEELFGFKPFRLIADHLTRHGIAVLRCDDRGVGGSTGSKADATTVDHAADVLAAVKFLSGRPEINALQIGLCGHSEGASVASIAASKSDKIAFIVLIAGPEIPGGDLILYQLESLMRAGGAGEEEIQKNLRRQKRVFECLHTGQGWELLAEDFRREIAASFSLLSPERRKAIVDSAAFVKAGVDARISVAKTPWFRSFVDENPSKALAGVRCPVLAVFGELDMQVPVKLNRQPAEDALKRGRSKDWKIEVLPKANHLFQSAVTGMPSEYGTLEKKFVPGFLDLVTGWITGRVTILGGTPPDSEN